MNDSDIDYTALSELITTFRNLQIKDSVTPESLGALLQRITDFGENRLFIQLSEKEKSILKTLKDYIDTLEHPVELKIIPGDSIIIADQNENPIVTFSNGNIRTDNFDSANIAHPISTKLINDADLIIADENEHPILTVSGGHIRTASFNSANITGSFQPTNPGNTEISNGSTSGTTSGCTLLRVMSWNIGHYSWGRQLFTAVNSENYEAMLAMWQKAYARYSPDVIAFQEYEKMFANNPSKETGEVLLPDYNIYPKSPSGGWTKNVLATLPKMSNICTVEIVSGEIVAECTINVGSKQVYLCSAHAPWSGVDRCRAYHRALIDRYADKEYVIIGLDTNVRAEAGFLKELKLMLRKAGFQSANWGYWGEIDTYLDEASPCLQALDNIFVKGADIVHAEVYVEVPDGSDADPDNLAATPFSVWQEVNPSDHAPIIADILFR